MMGKEPSGMEQRCTPEQAASIRKAAGIRYDGEGATR